MKTWYFDLYYINCRSYLVFHKERIKFSREFMLRYEVLGRFSNENTIPKWLKIFSSNYICRGLGLPTIRCKRLSSKTPRRPADYRLKTGFKLVCFVRGCGRRHYKRSGLARQRLTFTWQNLPCKPLLAGKSLLDQLIYPYLFRCKAYIYILI